MFRMNPSPLNAAAVFTNGINNVPNTGAAATVEDHNACANSALAAAAAAAANIDNSNGLEQTQQANAANLIDLPQTEPSSALQQIDQLTERIRQLEAQLQSAQCGMHTTQGNSIVTSLNNNVANHSTYTPHSVVPTYISSTCSNTYTTSPNANVQIANVQPAYTYSNMPIVDRNALPPQLNNTSMPAYAPLLRKLQDLPEFDGCPEDWPMFQATFINTTQAYGYTNLENNQRLLKCLKGEAKETVKCLLIHPDNVPNVMHQLSFRFGRPEQLIDSQLRKIKDVAPIADNCIERIVPFATKVRNLAVFLQTLNSQQHLSNPTLLESLIGKLPMTKRLEWAKYAQNIYPYPSIVHFSDWINEVADLILKVQGSSTKNSVNDSRRRVVLHATEGKQIIDKCVLCQGEHKINSCQQFIGKSVDERWELAKSHKLCFSCLRSGHTTQTCKRSCTRKGCNRKHNHLLHESQVKVVNSNQDESASHTDKTETVERAVLSCADNANIKSSILFRIIPVTLYGPSAVVNTYALLDEGASLTMIDAALISVLGLNGVKRNLNMKWIGGKEATEPVTMVDLQISGTGMLEKHAIKNVHGIANINLPLQSLNPNSLNINADLLKKLPIQSYCQVKPMLLIGLDNCHLGIPKEVISLKENGPYAAKTELGWVVFGPTNAGESAFDSCLLVRSSDDNLHEIVAEYFTTESFGVRPAPEVESEDDVRARHMLQSTTKIKNGRYELGLLWKNDDIRLPNSYNMALKRLANIEHKMKTDSVFANAYKEIIADYVKKNYARKLEKHEVVTNSPRIWYLPHFAVTNPNKPGKIRLVFDAAAKVGTVSLNSHLMKGPQEMQPMPSVLFNFRVGAVAVTGDIREMFHQILIRPEDRSAQRFLWRNGETTREPDIYEMCVMTFGATCSPCAAQYVKVINALNANDVNPRAVKAITKYHYVDDFVDSFSTVAEAVEISKQVREVHSRAGFELRRFVSNSTEVLDALGEEQASQAKRTYDENGLSTEKILGLYWQPACDAFKFNLKFHHVSQSIIMGERNPTKRELLSITMSVFDPLGFLSHLLITAKLLMREVWRENVGWDEQLPQHICQVWGKYLENIKQVDQVFIPRCFFPCGMPRNIQLHIFVDASEDAFAAVAYWRSVEENNEVRVSLICAKSKCAPMKLLSVPRLELQAAVLGSRLKQTILKEHEIAVEQCVLWSDSKTVLKWIALASLRYKPFVAHRIAEILSTTNVNNWRWLSTKDNVADEATRMNCETNLPPDTRWFQGPDFLRKPETEWPNEEVVVDKTTDVEELPPKFVLLSSKAEFVKFERFSSFTRLVRTLAQVRRFIYKCRKQHDMSKYGLTVVETNKAETSIYILAQQSTYAAELALIRSGKGITKGNSLHELMPYIDDDGVMRVSGRINAASWIPFDTRCPIIISPDHDLAKLIIMHYHTLMKHQNFEATMCEVRTKYWIPRLRQIARKVINNCKTCMLKRVKPYNPLMGQLPVDRITPYVRPFTFTGLDYFGPLNITVGRHQEKRWVALFTYLTIRAIHLEIAKDLSTDACIIVIRNFMNRRGVPRRIRSDNGRNFVGLANERKTFEETFDCGRIQDELTSKQVEWVFNWPHNPSEGGIWERMVQCVKRVLRHTMKSVAPHEHTLQSFIIEAENLINSRPLTHLPVTADQEEPLTPNHFLLGSANNTHADLTEKYAEKLPQRKQWRIAKQIRDTFWKRWVHEYLPTLTRRVKWCQREKPIQIGDLVYICDPDTPRSSWRRGMVKQVYAGADGEIRRVDVSTSNGIARRPVSRIAVLDVE